MLNCLSNKVSWWDGCGDRPNLLLLNDLTGFHLAMADFVTFQDPERQTATDIFNSAIRNGCDKVEQDVRAYLQPKMTFVESFGNKILGTVSENKKERNPDSYNYGIQVQLFRSPYFLFHLNSVYFFPKTSGTGNIKVYNTLTGTVLDTIAVTFTGAQINLFQIDKAYTFDEQAVNISIVLIPDAPTVVYDVQLWRVNQNCGSCHEGRYVNEYLFANKVKILPSAQPIDQNFLSAQHTGGIYINYNLVCDISDFICGMSIALKTAVWYQSGIKIMDEILFTDRLNSLTTINADKAKELKEMYEFEYSKIMERVVNSSNVPKSPCFHCNPTVRVATVIP